MSSAIDGNTLSQLVGGTASKIDTSSLVKSLMAAKSAPQDQLKDKLDHQQTLKTNLQELNRRMQSVTSTATAITDLAFDGLSTKASSSLSSVAASSSGGAQLGSATFHVDQTARAQVTIARATDIVDTPANGLDITVGGQSHHVDLNSGDAADVVKAVNDADLGVKASIVHADNGDFVQFTAASTGSDGSFSVSGVDSSISRIVDAQDAQISVGSNGGYTISSSTNTFTDAMPGVTFTVSDQAVGKDVTIGVSEDASALSDKVQDLVDAINTAKGGAAKLTAKGGMFQGNSLVTGLNFDMGTVMSTATPDGTSLAEFGIDMDKNGVVSFDAATFAAAYQDDPQGTLDSIIGGLADPMRDVSQAASTPAIGSLSQAITANEARSDRMSTEIDNWDTKLDKIHDRLVDKFTAMNSALAKLQSQGDWLTSMFDSMNGDD